MDNTEALQIQFYPRIRATFHCNEEVLKDFRSFLNAEGVSVSVETFGEQSGKRYYSMELSEECQDLSQVDGDDLITKFFKSRN